MPDYGDRERERFLTETRPPEVDGVKIDWGPLPVPNVRDLRGMRFGKLVVKAYAKTEGERQKKVYWLCQCDCGNDREVSRLHLITHGTKSCGCLSVVGYKGVTNATKKQKERAHCIERMRHGLPPVAPTEVIDDPANVFAYDSLMAYACLQWAGYEPAAHHHLIAKYLEKVEKGKIKRLMIFMPPRSGKLLAHDTWVMANMAWKRHGDLEVGDQVLGVDFESTTIIAVSEEDYATIEVKFSNGEKIQCHENHEWGVIDQLTNDYRVIETNWFFDQSLTIQSGYRFSLPYHDAHIIGIKPCPPALGRCVQVNRDNGLYLVGRSFIPTHNSMIVSEYFPAWYLGRNPDKRVIATSYGQELASDFGRKVRNQIADPMYSEIFPGVALAGDSAASDKFDLSPPHKGGYFAVGAGGAITGRGANCFDGDTEIITEHGRSAIKELYEFNAESPNIEIKVLSFNIESRTAEFKPILAYNKRTSEDIIRITTYLKKQLVVTRNHFIFDPVIAKYRRAGTFTVKDLLVAWDGYSKVKDMVMAVELIDAPERAVYDIEVADNHNLFANGILCHNCLIIDDPVKGREDSDSESSRRKIKDWYTSVAYTRLMDDGAIIICQTRWHVDDLAGWLLKEHKHEKWTVLNLPAINDKGEALWPERFPLSVLENIRKTLPDRDWMALYQQKPFIEEGNIYKRQWWKLWPDTKPTPECEFIIQSWDTAYSDADRKKSSYSARVTLGVFKRPDDECHNIMLLEYWKGRVEYAELRKEALTAYQDYAPDKVIIEKRASGQSLIQDIRRAGIPLTTYTPEKDKITRAYAAQSLLENGRLYYPSRRWAEEFVAALARFPNPDDDDVADAFSQAIIWLQSSFLVAHSDDAKRRKQEEQEEDDFLPSNVRRFPSKKKKSAYG